MLSIGKSARPNLIHRRLMVYPSILQGKKMLSENHI